MANITKKQREEVEKKVYGMMAKLDKSGTNEAYYRQLFGSMSDAQFVAMFKKEFPLRLQYKPSVVEPTMGDIKDALDFIKVPMMEVLDLNYLYKNKDGKAVQSQECFVGYCPHKKMQQFITSKNKWGVEINNRDMKTGRLIGADKGTAMSDREFESLKTLGLENTVKEFSRPKGDAMNAKNSMYNLIGTVGRVTLADIPVDIDDSLAKNMFNSYLIGAHLNSNLINQGDYTLYTLKEKRRLSVERS